MMFLLQRDDMTPTEPTLGQLLREDRSVVCQTLELPWRDNHHGVSCIPTGTYAARRLWSPAHRRELFWIEGVPDRLAIELHIGNTIRDTRGCILLGQSRTHLGDQPALLHSRLAFDAFMTELADVDAFSLTVWMGSLDGEVLGS